MAGVDFTRMALRSEIVVKVITSLRNRQIGYFVTCVKIRPLAYLNIISLVFLIDTRIKFW